MLHRLQGNTDLGYFSVGISLFEVSWIISRSAQAVFYANMMKSESHENVIDILNRFAKLTMFFSLFISIVILTLPDSFYVAVFGEYYSGINHSVKWFAPGAIAYNAYMVYQSYYLSKARYSGLIFINIIGFCAAIVAGYLFIPTKFFSGAAGAASLSFIVCAVLLYLKFSYDSKQSYLKILPDRGDFSFINSYLKSIIRKT